MYKVFSKTVIGASHIKKDIPCEDYSLRYSDESINIFAVADGHGDKRCFRSSIGSKKVCDAAAKTLLNFAQTLNDANLVNKFLDNKRYKEQTIRHLISSIFSEWAETVIEDFNKNPITEDEKILAGDLLEHYLRGERIEHIYGTTLIAGLQTEQYVLILHLHMEFQLQLYYDL